MDIHIFIITKDGRTERRLEAETRLCDIAQEYAEDAICALMDGALVSLADVPDDGSAIQFLSPYKNDQASRVFLRGATFLLYCAAKALFPDRTLLVDYMLCGGVYCLLGKLEDSDIAALEKKMGEYIAADEDFVPEKISIDAAETIMQQQGLNKKAALLSYRPFDYYHMYAFDGLKNYFHGIMPKNAGALKGARLFAYAEGFILKFPSPYIEASETLIEQPKYAAVFNEAEHWAEVLKASYVADINHIYQSGGINDFIRVNESLHNKMIADIADEIVNKKSVRIVLIAGPSSSGKTTFAKRLSSALAMRGKKCQPISIDDYYKPRPYITKDENGKMDFESLDAIDVQRLNVDLTALLAGEAAHLPEFDFLTGQRKERSMPLRIDDDILIIEGLHGLNDNLTKDIQAHMKFKIFIAPLTTLNLDNHSVVYPEDIRLMRRLVRDKRTRGYTFEHTFDVWDSVRRGEYKYILPYQESADVMFNSTLLYEPLILKKHCYTDLQAFTPDMPNYQEAQSLLKFLNYFLSARDESAIPPQSLLREFIGNE